MHHDSTGPRRGERTLLDAPPRVFQFLSALGTSRRIRGLLRAHGYAQRDHLEGWRHLLSCVGFDHEPPPLAAEPPAAAAVRELDAWDEHGFHLAHAALARKFPEQARFLLHDLAPVRGPGAMLGVMQFVDRLEALERGEGRPDSAREADRAALATLAARGLDAAAVQHLRELIKRAKSLAVLEDGPSDEAIREERMKNLEALFAWYTEWVEVARVAVTRRDDLITLGLAQRRAED